MTRLPRSGFCGLSNDAASHRLCRLAGCCCTCHHEPADETVGTTSSDRPGTHQKGRTA